MPRVSITIFGKNSQPYRFKLDRKKVTIGRAADCDIVIDCPSVSSLHCTMERVQGGYILRDRKSTNGIMLGDEEMAIIDLRNDNEVKVGEVKFDYTLSEDELDELDEEEFIPHEKKMSEVRSKPETHKPPKKKSPANVVTARAAPRPMAQPVLASGNSDGGSFLYGVAILVAGGVAFFAGMSNSYKNGQRKLNREGEFSLIQDIREGRPEIKSTDEGSDKTE